MVASEAEGGAAPDGLADFYGLQAMAVRAMVEGVDVPVNATAHPAKHTLERFAGLGIRRITNGPLLQAALTETTKDLLGAWRAAG